MSNLHQIGVAFATYGQDYADNLPRIQDPAGPGVGLDKAGSSLWDVPTLTGDALSSDGKAEIDMYCPGGYTRVQPQDYWWFYNTTPPTPGEYHVTSYVWLIDRNDQSKPDRTKFVAPRPQSFLQKMSVSYKNTFGYTVPLSDSELVMDVTVSEGSGTVNDKWTGIYTTNPNILPNGYSPNHMRGVRPTGGNILFQDNHVSWRTFQSMQVWYKWTNNRNFWW